MITSPIPGDAVKLGFDEWWAGATFDERRRVLDGAVDKVTVMPLSHDVARLFRELRKREVDPSRSPLMGVPKNRWSDVTRARLAITYRPEVVGVGRAAKTLRGRRRPGSPS